MASATAPSRSLSATTQRAPRGQRQPRAPRGTGFDLSGRQSRIRREETNARNAAREEEYRGASIGDLINSTIANSHKTKKGKTKPASFNGTSHTHGRSNETPIDSRHNQRPPRKSHKTSNPKPPQEYNALSDDFGPALTSSTPLATPSVSWGAHLNHRQKPAPKEATPEPVPEPSTDASVVPGASDSKEETGSQIAEQDNTQDIKASESGFTGFWDDFVDSDDENDDEDCKPLAVGDSWAASI